MNERIKSVLQGILDQFESGDVPMAIIKAMYPFSNIPSEKWSLCNRLLMVLSGTMDARGYNQWKSASRFVTKGSKAIYIVVPHIKKIEDGDKDKAILKGFGLMPVFRVEDTEGELLEYEQLALPDFPFMDRAEEWGISVKAIPGNYTFYGFYSPEQKKIGLATPEESTFFHELAHVAHEQVIGELKPGQEPLQEVVAELSAAVLCRMVGRHSDTLGNSYRYIKKYAEKLSLSPHQACLKVLGDTEKVLGLILASA
ncbi:MAG: antirestriction protein [Proteobacteria bacterium]|nr:antirestriction protein [Pseudomonadota bacterium]